MKKLMVFWSAGLLSLMLVGVVSAQPGGMMGSGTLSPSMAQFFGDIKAFTASAVLNMKGGMGEMAVPMDFALQDQLLRTEVDMSQMKGGMMPAGMGDQLRAMKMDKVVSVVDSTRKVTQIIFPGLKGYTEMPFPKDQADLLDQQPKLNKTPLGKETIAGHPCVKTKIVMTAANGKTQEATVWLASDLKDFPIQIQTTQEGNDVTVVFSNVKLQKPDAKILQIPADYTKHATIMELMSGAMMKMQGSP